MPRASRTLSPRVGLVLGAGGVLGGAWLVGALHAIASETGWDPGSADHVVGTSAGSMIAGLNAAGVPPWYMVAHSAGEELHGVTDANGDHAHEADRGAGAVYRLHRGVPTLGPGSWRLALGSLARPYKHAPAALVAGWLPAGLISTDPLKDTIRRTTPSGWPPHPNLWIVACDYGNGQRVPFGREGSPLADVADAVAASCAIPGFYRPVTIGGRRYVDGGLRSTSNLDLLQGLGLDLVVCLNPTSSLHAPSGWTLGDRVGMAMRQASGRRLGAEARKVRESGTEVILIQPTIQDLDAMGGNLMSRKRRHDVIEVAVETVREHLAESPEVRERLAGLPHGHPALVRRPKGPPARWPDFHSLAASRRSALAA